MSVTSTFAENILLCANIWICNWYVHHVGVGSYAIYLSMHMSNLGPTLSRRKSN